MAQIVIERLLNEKHEYSTNFKDGELPQFRSENSKTVFEYIKKRNEAGFLPQIRDIDGFVGLGDPRTRGVLRYLEGRSFITGIPFKEIAERYNISTKSRSTTIISKKLTHKMEIATAIYGYSINWPRPLNKTKFYVAMIVDGNGIPIYYPILL